MPEPDATGVEARARFDRVRYSQTWEDPEALLDALEVQPGDRVLSIAAGGDNSLALLLGDPAEVVALDLSEAQLALVELKIQAIRRLWEHREILGFLGVAPMPGRERLRLYRRGLRPWLSLSARGFWDRGAEGLARGVIHLGKLERYFRIFRRVVLPMVHSRSTILELLEERGQAEREAFYRDRWDTPAWRAMFRVFFGRRLLGRLGRDPEFFRYVTTRDVGSELLARARAGLTVLPTHDNYFLRYIVLGQYCRAWPCPDEHLPFIYRQANLELVESRIDRVVLVPGSLERYLPRVPAGRFERHNLSDVFEYVSARETAALFRELGRVTTPGGRVAYWTLLVPREPPHGLESVRRLDGSRAKTFFYRSLEVYRAP